MTTKIDTKTERSILSIYIYLLLNKYNNFKLKEYKIELNNKLYNKEKIE
jgi:hypothetical protein